MDNYVSTGKKILRHLDVLKTFQETGIIKTVSLQIAPTSRCNLNCCFCSNVNRDKHEDLNLMDIISFIKKTSPLTVEWTGGGDSTQYKDIVEAVSRVHRMGIKQGLITNGIDLVKNMNSCIPYFDWIRISLNSLDYVDDIEIPEKIKVLGFSYVINQKSLPETIIKMKEFVKKHNPKYVRIVPDCQTSAVELKDRNDYYSKLVQCWGYPYFYQLKVFTKPSRCWWGYFKPFLLHDGYVYPVVLLF